jgi:PPM family protein phosphatase
MIRSASLSDTGRKRQSNQDCLLTSPSSGLYLVADGLGGHAAGAVAARLTVSAIDDFVSLVSASAEVSWPFGYSLQISFEQNALRTAVLLANLKVCHSAEEREDCSGMGSTVVAFWARGKTAFWTHVGDSRLYQLRGGDLRQLSEDHSLVQEQLRRGIITPEEMKHHALKHVVTRAIGTRDPLEVNVQEQTLRTGDCYLLCCDGLTDLVPNQQIQKLIGSGEDLDGSCRALIAAANEAGGDDNITVVLIRVGD